MAGSFLAAPRAIKAQQAGKLSRIGWLSAGAPPDPFLEGFREGLRKLGYVEGQTIDFGGAKPGDLPVELTIPPSLLQRADQVIE